MKYKKVELQEIVDFPPSNSRLTKRDVYLQKKSDDNLPVYSASKDEDFVFGWVDKKSDWKNYTNALTWNTDGVYAGRVFYNKKTFVPYEKIKVMKIKPQYKDFLDYEYLRFVIELKLESMEFGFRRKCSMGKVKPVKIKIPVDGDGELDIYQQKILSDKYKKLIELKNKLKRDYEEIQIIKLNFGVKEEWKEVPLKEIFRIGKGDSKYTRKYIREHLGEYPVYSSQTTCEGVIGKIKTHDYNTKCLTWTTDGVHAGTVFFRNEKFSMTTHCGVLIPIEDQLNLKFICYQLRSFLKDYAVGIGNKRLTADIIGDVSIKIPLDSDGNFDLKKQKEHAERFERSLSIQNFIAERLKKVCEVKVEI